MDKHVECRDGYLPAIRKILPLRLRSILYLTGCPELTAHKNWELGRSDDRGTNLAK